MARDPQFLVDELSTLLGSPATLEDRHFNLVAFHAQSDVIDAVRQQSILHRGSSQQVKAWFEEFGITTASTPIRTPASQELGIVSRLCLPARWHEVNHGYFWLLDEHDSIDDRLLPQAMAIAAEAGAALAHRWRAGEEAETRLRALLSGDAELAEQAAAEVHDQGLIRRYTPVVAVVCDPGPGIGPGMGPGMGPLNVWKLPRRALVTTPHSGTVTVVVPLDAAGDLGPARRVAHLLRDLVRERCGSLGEAEAPVGVGAVCDDLAEIRRSWNQARLAADVARIDPVLRPVAEWRVLGAYRLLACGPRRTLAEAGVDSGVQRLLDASGADLVATARMFLDLAGDVQRTSAELNIHRQTLYQRLKRIEQVTGFDLADGRDRLVLHLGLTLAPALTPNTVPRIVCS